MLSIDIISIQLKIKAHSMNYLDLTANFAFIETNVFLSGLKNNTIPLQDFINAQCRFINCVNYWSQLLGRLIYRLPEYKDRKLILENLIEEHGIEPGHVSHVETFTNFMDSIGGAVNMVPDKAVLVFNNTLDSIVCNEALAKCIATFGYVEYYYQHISSIIVNYLKQNGKYTNIHYAEHELLDVKHYTDLFSLLHKYPLDTQFVAMQYGSKAVIELFDSYYTDSYLANKALSSTNPIMTIAKFGYHWEDPLVEESYIITNNKIDVKNILLVGSGGEVLFHLLAKLGDNLDTVTCLDFNPYQIELIKRKFTDISEGRLDEYYGSIFEDLFYQSFNDGNWNEHFSLDNLTKHFTETAVKYKHPMQSFSEHFKTRCEHMNPESSFYQLLRHRKYNPENRPVFYSMFDVVKRNWHKVTFAEGDIITYLRTQPQSVKYDFMSISNVTDWLSEYECAKLMELIENKLVFHGRVVHRRLFGYTRERNMACEGYYLLNISDPWDIGLDVKDRITDSTCLYTQILCDENTKNTNNVHFT